jgi:hypothetical protein
MKKFIAGFLTCIMLMGVVYAAETYVAQKATFKVVVDNVEQTFWYDVPPLVVDGRTMIPLRSVAESLNQTVRWDEQTQTVFVGQMPETNTYGDLQLTILNHGYYHEEKKCIAVDYKLENTGSNIVKFKCENFLFEGFKPIGFESKEIVSGFNDIHQLKPGMTFNIKMLYNFNDLGARVLANKRPYKFSCDLMEYDKIVKRVEILYNH